MDKKIDMVGTTDLDVSPIIDVSDVGGDYSLRLQMKGPGQDKRALLAIQCSTLGFIGQVRNLAVVHLTGDSPIELTYRSYQLTSSQVGHASAKMRIQVQAIDPGATVTARLILSA